MRRAEGTNKDEKDDRDSKDRKFPFLLLAVLIGCAGDVGGGVAATAPAQIRSGQVTLLVSPGDQNRSALVHLAAVLDRAVSEMAPRVPVTIASPITVVVEPDYVEQGRHAGEIGEAVRGRETDLHLVYQAADEPLYRCALARVLLARAGLAGKAPIALERGAALWLSRDWYGRPYPDWLSLLAAVRVLPEAAEILAAEEPPDASIPLWAPVAAAVVERLPGKTVAEKLARSPSAERVGEILSSLGRPGSAGVSPALALTQKRAGGTPALPGFLKGISLAMINRLEWGYHAPPLGRQLDAFAALGANAVSLMPFAFQPGPDRPVLRYLNRRPGSETDIGLIHATRLARARGFHVLYKPHLWLSHGSWPGEVRMTNEADWAAWWRTYRRYILHHAFLARWAGADLFSVGVELSQTVEREAEWRELIAAVRTFFPGAVTYSGNWYGDLEGVRFWDRLDFIGIDAYFPLSDSPQAGRADLARGAAAIAERLAAAARRWGRPVLLTEVGFAARRGAWVMPHTEGGEYSEEDQALAYQTLFKALDRQPWLAGTFVWKAFSAPGADRAPEADFRFMGRQAERVVKEYYKGGL
jgi:glycosyl hydrolase family 113